MKIIKNTDLVGDDGNCSSDSHTWIFGMFGDENVKQDEPRSILVDCGVTAHN